MDREELLYLAETTVEIAKTYGVRDSSVKVNNTKQSSIDIRNGKIDLIESSEEVAIILSLYINGKFSSNYTGILDTDSLKEFIKKSVEITKSLNKDDCRSLPDSKYYWDGNGSELLLEDKTYSSLKAEKKKDLTYELEETARTKSKRISSVTSSYSDYFSTSLKINSNGFIGEKCETSFSLGASVVVKDKNNSLPSGSFFTRKRFYKEIPDNNYIAENAVKYALDKIGQEKIKSGIYDMIVENRVASKLISMILSSITGSKLWDKNTIFDGKLGKKIFSDKLTIIDEPHLIKGLGSNNFDGDGFKTKRTNIVENGVLKKYLINDYYSKKLKINHTSGSTNNILLEEGDENLFQIISNIDRGILVTGFLGGNFNSLTGDFSFGVNGSLIESGKKIKPINEMNITGNILKLFSNLEKTGNDSYPYSSMKIPTLLFKDINFNGI